MTQDANEIGARFEDDTLDEAIRSWLDSEGYSSKKVTEDEQAAFHYIVQYPPGQGDANVHIVRPEGRSVLALLLGVQLSPNHRKPYQNLAENEKKALSHQIRRTAFEGGHVGFAGQTEDGILARWQLDVAVYDDGLDQDRFFQALRRLYTKHLHLIEVLNEELGDVDQGPQSTGGGISGYI